VKNRIVMAALAGFATLAIAPSANAGQAASNRAAFDAQALSAAPVPYAAPKAEPGLVAAGSYRLDKGHSSLTAQIRREGLSNFTFRFDRFDASFTYDPATPGQTLLLVTLDPTSVNANVAAWTEHLQAADLLNTAKFLQISFVSTSFLQTGAAKGVLVGNVTFLGFTKPMAIELTLNGVTPGPPMVVGFSGRSAIKMADFPMPGFAALHLGNDVQFDIQAEFIKR
jgi:polyisoprenoid-binding protein YceI